MIENLIPAQLPRGTIYFKEPTFYEYKNICKMLISGDNEHINNCFNILLDSCVPDSKSLDIIDKFKCIINIRNTILGNEIVFLQDGKRITLDLSTVLDKDIDNSDIEHSILTFNAPIDLHISAYDDLIAQCLTKVNGINVRDLTIDERLKILNETSFSLTEIYQKLHLNFKKRGIRLFRDIELNVYNSNELLQFLKNVFQEDLSGILNFEYTCIQNINLKAVDFKTYTYPELKIFLNYLHKERQENGKDTTEA
tara:strand:- start:1155 stop:1913 length:759 start_codon:yes stop_codon:yes gene_type:complete